MCIHIRNEKKKETFESLSRTLDCEYTRCNLNISHNSIITWLKLNYQLKPFILWAVKTTFQQIFNLLRKHNLLVVITKINFWTDYEL